MSVNNIKNPSLWVHRCLNLEKGMEGHTQVINMDKLVARARRAFEMGA